ncbi:MAG TPA: hypothetical protein VI911_11990 [Patescibacteria group bacterium]|nr:hypothetical protein [Patescibacteria group bacterium]
MAKIRKIEKIEENIMSPEDKVKIARDRRIRKAGLTIKQVEENVREEFRKYFSKVKRQLKLSNELEEIIWLHFKAMGFDSSSKFNEGLCHFGYKI